MLRHVQRVVGAGLRPMKAIGGRAPLPLVVSGMCTRSLRTSRDTLPSILQRSLSANAKSLKNKGKTTVARNNDDEWKMLDGEDGGEIADEDEDDEEWGREEWPGHGDDEPAPSGNVREARVGDLVPNFRAEQVLPSGDICQYRSLTDMENRYTIMLFYAADFSFVCPTEVNAFSDAAADFRTLGCDVVAISTDQIHSHVTWVKVARADGGVEGLQIPLLADPTHEITKAFGIYDEEAGHAKRATVIVDTHCRIVHTSVNCYPIGRSVEEVHRLIKALDFVDTNMDQACPVSWTPGSKTITLNHSEKSKYFKDDSKQ